jgi:Glycosyltransferase family 87
LNTLIHAPRYRSLLVAFCVLAILKFLVRGPIRAAQNSGDFRAVYLASRAWSQSRDCYDPESIKAMWSQVAGPDAAPLPPLETHALYPPTTYALLSPIALMPWNAAKLVWCVINTAALVVLAICVAGVAGIRWRAPRGLLVIASVLALEPASTAIMLGQPSILAITFAAASLLGIFRDSNAAAGLLEGLAIGLKPQLAGALAIAYLLQRRWLACIGTAIASGLLSGIAIARLSINPGWIRHYIADIAWAFGPGGPNDFSSNNPNLVELINLRYPLSILLGNNLVANNAAQVVALLLLIPPVVYLARRRTDSSLLHCASILTLIDLIAIYHRSYDAIAITVPLAWSLSAQIPRKSAWPIWVGAVIFMLLSAVGIRSIGAMPWFPAGITSSAVWNAVVVPYQAWALLLMALWMDLCLLNTDHAPPAADATSTAG